MRGAISLTSVWGSSLFENKVKSSMSLVNLFFSEMTNFKCFLSADIFSVRAMHWLRSNERRDSSFSRHYAFHRPMPKLNIENNRLREFLIIANRLFREVFGHSLTLRNDRAVGAKASHVRRLLCDVISFEPELERLAKEESESWSVHVTLFRATQ